MINLNTDKKLNIILPNTNKALEKVLIDATPSELELVSDGKDLKSIISSLLKKSSQNSSTDKSLLELVKNNQTLKELANANINIKELLNTIRSDKSVQHLEKSLQKFLPNIKELTSENLKPTMENSGVFLESKIKNIKNPLLELKTLLNELNKILSKSHNNNSNTIINSAKEIINSPVVNSATNTSISLHVKKSELETVLNGVKSIVDKLRGELKNTDPINTKEFSNKLNKISYLIDPQNQNYNLKPATIKDALIDINKTLKNSFTNESKNTLESIKNILNKINTLETINKESSKQIPEINKSIKNSLETLKIEINKNTNLPQSINSEISSLESKIKAITPQINETKLAPIIESIQQISTTIQNNNLQSTNTIIEALNKIFNALKKIELNYNLSEQLINKKVPLQIKEAVNDIKQNINSFDPIFSKDVKHIFDSLSKFNTLSKLTPDANIKDILSNDFKAVLSKISDEIVKISSPTQNELLKQIDKLSLQIDYHQLVSHLSNSSSLYLPYSWDDMENGTLSMKKSKEDIFFCDIELKLKEYGELKIRLTLYDENQLNIHIDSDSDKFKKIITENIPSLRKALIDSQITPREIRFVNYSKNRVSNYDINTNELDIGFEVKA